PSLPSIVYVHATSNKVYAGIPCQMDHKAQGHRADSDPGVQSQIVRRCCNGNTIGTRAVDPNRLQARHRNTLTDATEDSCQHNEPETVRERSEEHTSELQSRFD